MASTEQRRMTEYGSEHTLSEETPLAPVYKIPVEVLREIFLLVCGYYERQPPPIEVSTLDRTQQWTLSHVCGLWRAEIASCTPLWSNIVAESPSKRRHETRFMDLILERARDYPLRIRFESESREPSQDLLFISLLTRSRSWQNVQLTAYRALLLELEDIKNKIPNLHTLKLICRDFHRVSNLVFLSNAPALRHLHLHGQFVLKSIRVRWDQLTHLILCMCVADKDTVLDLPNLRHLSIQPGTKTFPRFELPPVPPELEVPRGAESFTDVMELLKRSQFQTITLLPCPRPLSAKVTSLLQQIQSVTTLRFPGPVSELSRVQVPSLQTLVLEFEEADTIVDISERYQQDGWHHEYIFYGGHPCRCPWHAVLGFIYDNPGLRSIVFQGNVMDGVATEEDVVNALELQEGEIRVVFEENG